MILVTGATGFVGTALCHALRARGTRFVAAVRTANGSAEQVSVGNIDVDTSWSDALNGCDTVIHLAARVHVMADAEANPLDAYRRANVAATLNLARQAVQAGVKRFIFVSSVKVNGEATSSRPFTAFDVPAPCDPYGQSKWEAELALQELARVTGLELVIVRPPLVYGPGVKANFLNLIRLVQSGLPLPFGRAAGLRSMVAVDNLVHLLIHCASHPNAPGGVFMVSDGEDITVGDVAKLIAIGMNKRVLLVPIPVAVLRAIARVLGAARVADRLFGSLQVDMRNTQERLEWQPDVTAQAAIRETVKAYLVLKG